MQKKILITIILAILAVGTVFLVIRKTPREVRLGVSKKAQMWLEAGSKKTAVSERATNGAIVAYDVKSGDLVYPHEGELALKFAEIVKDREGHQEIWQMFSSLVPNGITHIIGFDIVTDGPDDSVAYVYQDQKDPRYWHLAVDYVDALVNGQLQTEILGYAFLHESGHLLSLNSDQVDFVNAKCPRFVTAQGCSREDSYINKFYREFWLDAKGGFVSEYAATNTEEDFAESYARFILEPHPTGESRADLKIKFFYNFPELVVLRDELQEHLLH
ncbi:MAG TPA: hypothetical protein VEA59_02040 [Patescibacteria group bacterium]|nr:hypothetical protein [Patescibacteria group bacterium]